MSSLRREAVCHQHQVAALYAFGSRSAEAREWLAGSASSSLSGPADLDIGARPRRGVQWDVKAKVQLAQALEDLFESSRVDLVVLPEADPFLAAEVIRGERLFVDDEHEADEYDLYVLRRAGDLVPLERERVALVLGRES